MVSWATYCSWMHVVQTEGAKALQDKLDRPSKGHRLDRTQPSQTAIAHRQLLRRSNVERKCRVPKCSIRNCRLRTHVEFTPKSSRDGSPLQSSDNSDVLSGHSGSIDYTFDDQSDFAMVKNVDTRPALPLDGLESSRSYELFHMFSSSLLDYIFRLTEPPPVSLEQKHATAKFKTSFIVSALTDPIVCAQSLAAAYIILSFGKERQLDRTAMVVQGKLMGMLRRQLSQNTRDMNGFKIAMTIYAIAIFEIGIGETATLTKHRDAMARVVSSMGGLHNMGRATTHIFGLDRLVSNFTHTPLVFQEHSYARPQRPFQYPYRYGSCFEEFRAVDPEDQPIIDYCLDSCRLIELLEGLNFSFSRWVTVDTTSTDLHYLYYVRESNISTFASLNAETVVRQDLYRCILLTTGLMVYSTVQGSLYATLVYHRANEIRTIIENQTFHQCPLNQHILIWIFFVLSTLEAPWPGKQWALQELGSLLNNKYGGRIWPVAWKEAELANVRSFIWCDTLLQRPLELVFRQLDHQVMDFPSYEHTAVTLA